MTTQLVPVYICVYIYIYIIKDYRNVNHLLQRSGSKGIEGQARPTRSTPARRRAESRARRSRAASASASSTPAASDDSTSVAELSADSNDVRHESNRRALCSQVTSDRDEADAEPEASRSHANRRAANRYSTFSRSVAVQMRSTQSVAMPTVESSINISRNPNRTTFVMEMTQ